jgi:uncharacterized RDD family membrane protein YckC
VTATVPREVVVADTPAGGEVGLITRAIAFTIDVLFVDVVAWIVGGALAVVASLFDLPDNVQTVLIAVGAAAALLWVVGYFAVYWASTGQTLGNRIMQIRVRSADADAPLGLGRALLRVLGAFLSALILFLGFAMIVVDPRRRGLLDYVAGSVVVHVPDERGRQT